jgi:hypothetical protein
MTFPADEQNSYNTHDKRKPDRRGHDEEGGAIMSRLGIALVLALSALSACAQETWPSKAVKIIVPSSPGGGTDLYARLLAQGLSEGLKQQFIVDNR